MANQRPRGARPTDRRQYPIAVFDSGLGGISVLRCLLEELPGEDYLYFGDSANAPYGTRPEEEVRELSEAALRFLMGKDCKAAVMEVSSQGLMLNRTGGIRYDIGVFTNISPDHIGPNEHKSFEEYLMWKSKLFTQCRVGIVNIDDPHAQDIMANAE